MAKKFVNKKWKMCKKFYSWMNSNTKAIIEGTTFVGSAHKIL